MKKGILAGVICITLILGSILPDYVSAAERKEIKAYEITGKIFQTDIICDWLLEGKADSAKIEQQKNGSITVQADESNLFMNNGMIEFERDKSVSDIETLFFYYILSDLVKIEEPYIKDQQHYDACNEAVIEQIETACQLGEGESIQLNSSCCLDKEILEQLAQELEKYGEEHMDTSKWTAEEYIGLEYELVKDNIPVMGVKEPTQGYYLDIAGAAPVYIRVLLGDERILGLSIQGMFEEKKNNMVSIISKEEAIRIAEEEEADIILKKGNISDEVKLEYVPIPDWNTGDGTPIELRTYWCIIKEIEEGEEKYTEAVRINAITGGNLSYGE